MEKMLPPNQERLNKRSKSKKKEPPKVVYITNPMKFKTSPSEFKALVQELTGKDATYPLQSTDFPMPDGVGGSRREEAAEAEAAAAVVKVGAEDNVLELEEAVRKMEQPSNGEEVQKGLDPSAFGWNFDACYSPEIENFQGSDLLDVLQYMDAM